MGSRGNGRSVGGRGRTWSASARSNASGSAFMMSSSSAPTRVLTSSGARRPEAAAASRARAASSSCSERPDPSFAACATVVGVPRLGANRRNAPRAGLSSIPRAPYPGATLRERLPRDAPASAGHPATRHGPAVASACVDMLGAREMPSAGALFREAADLGLRARQTRTTAVRRAPVASPCRCGSSRRLTRTHASSRAWWSRARVSAGRVGVVFRCSFSRRATTVKAEPRWRFSSVREPRNGPIQPSKRGSQRILIRIE